MGIKLNPVLFNEIQHRFGFAEAQNVATFIANLPPLVIASGDVGRLASVEADAVYRHGLLSWAEGLMDGVQTYLRIQGVSDHAKVRDFLWTNWTEIVVPS